MNDVKNYSTILLEKKEGVATVTLNRPEKLNAFNEEMAQELINVFEFLDRDDESKVVVFTGAGRAFCAGADIGGHFLTRIEQRKKGALDNITEDLNERLPLALAALRKPVIAAVNGPAIGWGCTITLPCDIRFAAENARFSLAFTRMGISPEMGATYFLPRLIGIGMACELTFTARMVGAQEAKEIGLVNQVLPADELMKFTYETAKTIAKMPPLAIRITKKALYQGMNNDLPSQLRHEAFAINFLRRTDDHEEGARAFLEKREPNFKGR